MANAPAATPLAKRIENSLREGRLPQALELARQHAHEQPGDHSQTLLRKCYLKFAESHVHRGALRDALSILAEAEKLACDDPAWWERLAELRADLGDHSRSLQLAEKLHDPAIRPRILGRVADRSLKEGAGGRAMVPDEFKPQFDAVRKAFAEYEAGRDESAREVLNSVGLGSPYLEWKLLLRGLIAWTANDTPRAIENWSRLSPDRLPAKLAAPIRFTVDRSFLAKVPTEHHSVIARQSEQLTGGVVDGLRRLRKQLATEDLLPSALDTARAILPELNRMAPELVPRLANVCYWSILMGGQPDDMPRHARVFGPPPDDPAYYRLQAMVMETTRQLDKAHTFWAKYEEWIAKSPNRWPSLQAERARALIYERMGRLALDWIENEGEEDDADDFFAMFSRNTRRSRVPRKPLKPSADECFRKASELAPDWITPALARIALLRKHSPDSATAIQDILQRFPNNLAVLLKAAEFHEEADEPDQARDCIRRALAANPLDRDLRSKVASFALDDARRLAIAKDPEAAFASMKEAANVGTDRLLPTIHALSAAVFLNTKQPDSAIKHLDVLRNLPNARLASAYRLAVEGSRVKMKKKELTPWTEAFESELAIPFTIAEAAELLSAHSQYLQETSRYRGHLVHQKKILQRVLSAASNVEFNETDRVKMGIVLHQSELWKPLGELGERNLLQFPKNPYFLFFVAEAKIARSKATYVSYRVGYNYRRIKQLISKHTDGRYRELQQLLDERLKQTPDLQTWLRDMPFDI